MTTKVLLLVGTKKGAFVLDGDPGRDRWAVRGPLCEGWPVHDIRLDPSDGALIAGAGSPWYGPAVWRSEDLGETWTHSSAGLTYGDDGPSIPTVWNVTPAHGALYAGVEPAGLFRSDDRGATWSHVSALRDHPSRPEWQPGAGGLCLHTIIAHPTEPERMWVGISAVGVFETIDGGAYLGRPQPRRPGRLPARGVPGVRAVRPQGRPGGGRCPGWARAAVPAEPLRRLSDRRRRRPVDGDHR